jgi:GABA(A) receptor-associated protein
MTSAAIAKIRIKYPDHVPVFIEKYAKCILPNLTKKKYLVPKNFAMGHILIMIRKSISLMPSEAIYIYVNSPTLAVLLHGNDSIIDIYNRYCHEDGMLHVIYATENTFGF